MAMKELVDRDCGGANPVMKMATHFTQDHALRQEGVNNGRMSRAGLDAMHRPFGVATEEEMVNEFLAEPVRNMAPQTFHMDGLLREMHEIDGAQMRHAPQRGPTVADLAASDRWAKEFASEATSTSHNKWASEFLDQHPQPNNALVTMPQAQQTPWAQEFLEQSEHKVWNNEETELAKSANELLATAEGTKLQNTEEHASLSDKWADEFHNKTENVETADADFWNNLQQQWEDTAKNDTEGAHAWLSDYTDFQADNYLRDYRFEEDNPLRDHPDPFSEGVAKLKLGDIPNAVLLFEAAVQKDETHAEAWQYLGTTQADNEQEPAAIAALNKCLEITPDNLTARMALAVSYTNESLQHQACLSLREWLQQNPRYSNLVPPQADEQKSHMSSFMSEQLALDIKQMYLKAVQRDPEHMDADLQIGLGVLFNLTAEYDRAVDCFNAALQLRPADSLLWNKLGATLANGGRSEEAVEAYKQALNLAPGYVRTRYNLGIACINLNAYKQAVEHFLTSLNQQKQSEGPQGKQSVTSNNIWTTMRMAISLMGKPDLYQACDNRDIDTLNQHFGMQA